MHSMGPAMMAYGRKDGLVGEGQSRAHPSLFGYSCRYAILHSTSLSSLPGRHVVPSSPSAWFGGGGGAHPPASEAHGAHGPTPQGAQNLGHASANVSLSSLSAL